MSVINTFSEKLRHITVEFDQQGRLILDNQGKKYEVTLESTDAEGNTAPVVLQRNDTTDKIKALIAGVIQAHVLHDAEPADMLQIDRQGLYYANGTPEGLRKEHDFAVWHQPHKNTDLDAASKELTDDLIQKVGGSHVDEMFQAQEVWNRLQDLILHLPQPSKSPRSNKAHRTSPQTRVADPMRPINPHRSPPQSQNNLFPKADDEISVELDLTPKDLEADDEISVELDLTPNRKYLLSPPSSPSEAGSDLFYEPPIN